MKQWQWAIIANEGLMIISKLIDSVLMTKKNENNGIRTSRFIYIGKPIFKGEIDSRQEKYERGKDHVIFKA
ncbi:MAG TPA: hypothetical protein VGC75_01040, partial [Candidatus Nitrosocosmicus sp.]